MIFDCNLSLIVSEKSDLMSKKGKISFWVHNIKLTKKDIQKGFLFLFPEIDIVNISTMNYRGKKKIFKGKEGFRSDRKKVIVTLRDSSKSVDILNSLISS